MELTNGTGELYGKLQLELLDKERHHKQLQVNDESVVSDESHWIN